MTIQLEAAALGAYSAEISPPAENSPISASLKSNEAKLVTLSGLLPNITFFPSLLSLAST